MGASLTFTSVADASVSSSQATKNFGRTNGLDVRLGAAGATTARTFLRFQVSGVSLAITAARLRLYATDGSVDGGTVYTTTATWSETTITWANAPAIGTRVLGSKTNAVAKAWTDIALDPTAFSGNGTYGVALTSRSTDVVTYASRETTNKPQLILDLAAASTATPNPTPMPTPVATPVPTLVATPVPTPVPTPVTTPVPTAIPTPEVTPLATVAATPVATAAPTPDPTAGPTVAPTAAPTPVPTPSPSPEPTPTASPDPGPSPSPSPAAEPSPSPSPEPSPSSAPSISPSPAPLSSPDPSPTAIPASPAPPTAAPSPTPSPTPTPPAAGFTFYDDFDGAALSPLWLRHFNFQGIENAWDMAQTRVADGMLTITANRVTGGTKPWVSGLLDTKTTWTQLYGTFEARIKVPQGKGLWPAFWAYYSTTGYEAEIDAMEVCANPVGINNGNDVTLLHQVMHWTNAGSAGRNTRSTDLSTDFHVYGVDWRADHISFYLDGVETWKFTDVAHIPNVPLPLILNLAVGGTWCSATDATTPDGSQMLVDWVRARP